MTALEGYRVLDLTSHECWLAGKLLADLGADVLKIETPEGDSGRQLGPFAHDEAEPDNSLRWWAYNKGKRSVGLDLESPHGRESFLELVGTADAVIESFPPGAMDGLAIGYQDLSEVKPSIVLTSITPFGQTGPHAAYQGSDLVLAATGGLAYLTGDPDRPPVRVSEPQSFLHGATEGALATAIGLYDAARTGVGQRIDVSAQLGVVRVLMNATAFPKLEGVDLHRQGGASASSYLPFQRVFRCRDGWAYFPAGHKGAMHQVAELLEPSEPTSSAIANTNWTEVDFAELASKGDEARQLVQSVDSELQEYFGALSKADIRRLASEGLLVAPLSTVADIASDEQLAARDFFVHVARDDHEIRHAGPWVRMTATPLKTTQRSPHIGEHTEEVLDSLRSNSSESDADTAEPGHGDRPDLSDVFRGLRVWDMSWVGVGPITARYLAEHGADVIHLDSLARPDILRLSPPFSEGRPGINNSMYFGDFNASKRSIGLDLKQESAQQIARELAAWADVVIESFAPGVVERWGLSYEELRQNNPSLVMLSTSIHGQTGPRNRQAGFGNMASAAAGFYQLTGWPDRDPVPIYGAYSDFICPRFNALALVAALDHRRRTGEGQYIDSSQFEIALQYLAVPLLDYEVNGRIAERMGNSDPNAAPHGVYPCASEDTWIAITVETDEQWHALVRAMGEPTWGRHPSLATASKRKQNEAELETRIARWTSGFEAHALMKELQPEVPAGVVYSQSELYDDPQIQHRNYFTEMDHPAMGRVPYNGSQTEFSKTKPGFRMPSPCVGEHSFEVLTEVLNYDDEQVADLLATQAVVITGG